MQKIERQNIMLESLNHEIQILKKIILNDEVYGNNIDIYIYIYIYSRT